MNLDAGNENFKIWHLFACMISVNNLSIQFSGETLFDDITFIVNDKDRIGLVGKNGAGKTTLLNIIAGLQEPETGKVVIPAGSIIGYLPQDKVSRSALSVYEEAKTAFSEILSLNNRREKLSKELSERTDYESDNYLQLCEELTHLEERYSLIGAANMEGVIVHYEVDFYKPVLLHDHFYVETAFAGCGTKSKLKCICKTIMSGLNKQTGNAEILTEGFKQEMERFENNDL